MTAVALNRTQASKRARLAQGLVIALLAGGGVALAFGMKSGSDNLPPSTFVLPVKEVVKPVAIKTYAIDTSGVGERFSQVANHPTPVDAPPPAATVASTPTTAIQPPPQDLRFLGMVSMGSQSMALVMDGDKQRFVAVGDHLNAGTVESISEHDIKVSGTTARTVELAAKSNDVISHMGAKGGVRPPNAPGMTAAAQVNRPGGGLAPAPQQVTLAATPAPDQPIPEYIRPEQADRFQAIRNELREAQQMGVQKFGSDEELNEYAAKMTTLEESDPKSAKEMRMKFEDQRRAVEKARSVKGKS